jgi:hypothetical protein
MFPRCSHQVPSSFQCVHIMFPMCSQVVLKIFLKNSFIPNVFPICSQGVPIKFPICSQGSQCVSPRVFPIAPHFNPICLARSPPPSIECWTTETCATNWVLKSCCCKYDGSFGSCERKWKCMCNFLSNLKTWWDFPSTLIDFKNK